MSYYKDLVGTNGGFRSFLFQVNDLGEMVIYRLGENGKVEDFASGKVELVLLFALRAAYPQVEIQLNNYCDPLMIDGNCLYFHELAAILNQCRSSIRRARVQEACRWVS